MTQNQGEKDEDMTNMHITIWNVIKTTKKVEQRSKNVHIKLEAQSNLILSLSQNPGVGCTKMDVRITYELCLGHSTYRRKYMEITFPTQLVSPQNSFGVDENRRNNLTSRIYQDVASMIFRPEGHVRPRVARPPPWPPPKPLSCIYSVAVNILDGFCLD
jgi:hypothetical protein